MSLLLCCTIYRVPSSPHALFSHDLGKLVVILSTLSLLINNCRTCSFISFMICSSLSLPHSLLLSLPMATPLFSWNIEPKVPKRVHLIVPDHLPCMGHWLILWLPLARVAKFVQNVTAQGSFFQRTWKRCHFLRSICQSGGVVDHTSKTTKSGLLCQSSFLFGFWNLQWLNKLDGCFVFIVYGHCLYFF
jgi:hypothetical protein